MPLVFVHGVSNRDSPEYRENQLSRNAFFRSLVLPRIGVEPDKATIFNPYWGDAGVTFRWGNASLPEDISTMESFGTATDPADLRVGADVLAAYSPDAANIVAVANRKLVDAVDIVYAAAMPTASSADEAKSLADSYLRAIAYAEANPKPAWLKNAKQDNFVDLLLFNAKAADVSAAGANAVGAVGSESEWESFGAGGLFDSLKEGISRLSSVGSAGLSSAVTALGRKRVHLGASLFIGDVFQYLQARGNKDQRGPIVQTVLSDFRSASELASPADPLVVVSHSLGGVISYDILTHFDPTIEVDVFVTVGSQVALFAEMSLYRESKPNVPPNPPADRLARPGNIKRWLNVLDGNDIFSFRAEGVFTGVQDFKYETGYGVMEAHGGYFRRPSFYRRLGERLTQP
jgi:hypothetical protein